MLCDASIIQKSSGYTNLINHLKGKHVDYEATLNAKRQEENA